MGELAAFPLAHAVAAMDGVQLMGLMTIAPKGDLAVARSCFRSLRQLRNAIEHRIERSLPELSMGMSDDFEVAVEEGATMVRLGRVLFGER